METTVKQMEEALQKYEAIEDRIKLNIERAKKYRDADDICHDESAQAGADIMSLMQIQSQVIRLSEYIDQQHISLVEIQRQKLELEKELEELQVKSE